MDANIKKVRHLIFGEGEVVMERIGGTYLVADFGVLHGIRTVNKKDLKVIGGIYEQDKQKQN
jgi:hypothetical protein